MSRADSAKDVKVADLDQTSASDVVRDEYDARERSIESQRKRERGISQSRCVSFVFDGAVDLRLPTETFY